MENEDETNSVRSFQARLKLHDRFQNQVDARRSAQNKSLHLNPSNNTNLPVSAVSWMIII